MSHHFNVVKRIAENFFHFVVCSVPCCDVKYCSAANLWYYHGLLFSTALQNLNPVKKDLKLDKMFLNFQDYIHTGLTFVAYIVVFVYIHLKH